LGLPEQSASAGIPVPRPHWKSITRF